MIRRPVVWLVPVWRRRCGKRLGPNDRWRSTPWKVPFRGRISAIAIFASSSGAIMARKTFLCFTASPLPDNEPASAGARKKLWIRETVHRALRWMRWLADVAPCGHLVGRKDRSGKTDSRHSGLSNRDVYKLGKEHSPFVDVGQMFPRYEERRVPEAPRQKDGQVQAPTGDRDVDTALVFEPAYLDCLHPILLAGRFSARPIPLSQGPPAAEDRNKQAGNRPQERKKRQPPR